MNIVAIIDTKLSWLRELFVCFELKWKRKVIYSERGKAGERDGVRQRLERNEFTDIVLTGLNEIMKTCCFEERFQTNKNKATIARMNASMNMVCRHNYNTTTLMENKIKAYATTKNAIRIYSLGGISISNIARCQKTSNQLKSCCRRKFSTEDVSERASEMNNWICTRCCCFHLAPLLFIRLTMKACTARTAIYSMHNNESNKCHIWITILI